MYTISLKNGKTFLCQGDSTIFEAAKMNGIVLEHSCLSARCRNCAAQLLEGTTLDKIDDLVLSPEEKINNWILTCNSIPTSNLVLNIDDLRGIKIFEKKITPAKIQCIKRVNENIIEVRLRLPPNTNFRYISGQYVNITRGTIKRSYSIANSHQENGLLTFFIRKYQNGQMSKYWFNEAKENDLVRIEGPLGSFFFRESIVENIVFLATGTGVAPIKAILESIGRSSQQLTNKKLWLFVGARNEDDIFWHPSLFINDSNFNYIPVLSKASEHWKGESGYVQDILIKLNIPLAKAQVYACGSNNMIESAKKLLIENGLNKIHFFSDAFVQSN
jgi:CDP-4-dehydro-6-deoxyglucose reductase